MAQEHIRTQEVLKKTESILREGTSRKDIIGIMSIKQIIYKKAVYFSYIGTIKVNHYSSIWKGVDVWKNAK